MKILSLFLFLLISDYSIAQQKPMLTVSEVSKILGEPVKLMRDTSSTQNGVSQKIQEFIALKKDAVSGKTGNLYYMMETYPKAEPASKLLNEFLESNRRGGAKSVSGIGDEAFTHTDNQNFMLIIARKKNVLIRLKINKLTSVASTSELIKAAKRLLGDK